MDARTILFAIAKVELTRGLYLEAVRKYEACGEKITREETTKCAETMLEKGARFEDAKAVFAALGIKKFNAAQKKMFVRMIDSKIEHGKYDGIPDIAAYAGVPVPAKRLIEIAEKYVFNHRYIEAVAAYKASGRPLPEKELLRAAEFHLARGNFGLAEAAFRSIGQMHRMAFWYVEDGLIHMLETAYGSIENVPTEYLYVCFQKWVAQKKKGERIQADVFEKMMIELAKRLDALKDTYGNSGFDHHGDPDPTLYS